MVCEHGADNAHGLRAAERHGVLAQDLARHQPDPPEPATLAHESGQPLLVTCQPVPEGTTVRLIVRWRGVCVWCHPLPHVPDSQVRLCCLAALLKHRVWCGMLPLLLDRVHGRCGRTSIATRMSSVWPSQKTRGRTPIISRCSSTLWHVGESQLRQPGLFQMLLDWQNLLLRTVQAVQEVEVPLHKCTGAGLSGVLWLELDCDDVLSEPVLVVLCPNVDVVDELNELEDDLEAGR